MTGFLVVLVHFAATLGLAWDWEAGKVGVEYRTGGSTERPSQVWLQASSFKLSSWQIKTY